jgi:hypothetical protein
MITINSADLGFDPRDPCLLCGNAMESEIREKRDCKYPLLTRADL